MYSLTGDHGNIRLLQLQTYLEFLMVLQYNLCVVKAQGFVIASRACSLTNTRRGTLKKSLDRDVPPRPLLRHILCISPPKCTTNVDPSPGVPYRQPSNSFTHVKASVRKRLISSRELNHNSSHYRQILADVLFTDIFPHWHTT